MRKPRTPSWARPPRWASSLRPKLVAAPRPTSLISLVKNQDHWELQQRICAAPSVMREIPAYSDFWTTQWPALLRAACKTRDTKCLELLLDVKGQGKQELPPLPPQFLGWLIQGLGVRNERYSDVPAWTQTLIRRRVSDSRVALRKEDGLALLQQGGPDWALYTANKGEENALYDLPVVEAAWKKWCAKPEHARLAVDGIVAAMGGNDWRNTHAAFTNLMKHTPEPRREGLATLLLDEMKAQGWGSRRNPDDKVRVGKWFKQFGEQGWGHDHPIWPQWSQTYCQDLAGIEKPSMTSVAHAWASTVLLQLPEGPAPLGWTWNTGMARGFFLGRATPILSLLEKHETGVWIGDQAFAQAATWLRETREVWERLGRMGLADEPGQRVEWLARRDEALGADWMARMERMVAERHNDRDAQTLVTQWTQWKAHELALLVEKREVKPRSLKM